MMNRMSVIACVLLVGLSAHAQVEESDELEGLIPAPQESEEVQNYTQAPIKKSPVANRKGRAELSAEPALGMNEPQVNAAEGLADEAAIVSAPPAKAQRPLGAASVAPVMRLPGMPLAPNAESPTSSSAAIKSAPQVSYLEELEGLRIPRAEFSSQSTFLKDGALKSKTLK